MSWESRMDRPTGKNAFLVLVGGTMFLAGAIALLIIEVRWFNEWWGVGGLVGGIIGSPILGPIFPVIYWVKAEFSLLHFGLLALALVGLQINRLGSDRATLSSTAATALSARPARPSTGRAQSLEHGNVVSRFTAHELDDLASLPVFATFVAAGADQDLDPAETGVLGEAISRPSTGNPLHDAVLRRASRQPELPPALIEAMRRDGLDPDDFNAFAITAPSEETVTRALGLVNAKLSRSERDAFLTSVWFGAHAAAQGDGRLSKQEADALDQLARWWRINVPTVSGL